MDNLRKEYIHSTQKKAFHFLSPTACRREKVFSLPL